ncbi:hypothetical protein NE865_06900 [Phthorimaea operculella]|nr:hypothetical protein NE865_06900 [Phthorimaea operculella]
MATNNRKGPIVDPGLCRCCNTLKKCRLLNVEYEWIGQREVYSDMFMDTFGLLLSNLDGEAAQRLICATCVSRLRDASSFRKQVLCCEETLLQAQLAPDSTVPEIKQETDEFDPKFKLEQNTPLSQAGDCIDDDDDDAVELEGELFSVIGMTEEFDPKFNHEQNTPLSQAGDCIDDDDGNDAVELEEGELISVVAMTEEFDPKFKHKENSVPLSQADDCNDDDDSNDAVELEVELEGELFSVVAMTEEFDPKFKHEQNSVLLSQAGDCIDDDVGNDAGCEVVPEDPKTAMESDDELPLKPAKTKVKKIKKEKPKNKDKHTKKVARKSVRLKNKPSVLEVIDQLDAEEMQPLEIPSKPRPKPSEVDQQGLHNIITIVENSFVCPFDNSFSDYICVLRYRHMIDIHGDKRMYQCSHCDRAYDSRKSLREHNRRYHLKIFKHQCDLCDKRFYIPSRLKEHLATHSGERNFRCELCGKSYPRLRGLKSHLQSHYSENKYRCTLCGASFTQNSNLNNHMKRRHQQDEIGRDAADAISSNI